MELVTKWTHDMFQNAFGTIKHANVRFYGMSAEVTITTNRAKYTFTAHHDGTPGWYIHTATSWEYYAGKLNLLEKMAVCAHAP